MRISIAAIGRLKSGPERQLVERYLERANGAGKQMGLTGFDIQEFSEARHDNSAQRKRQEAEQLLGCCPEGARLIALDERGRTMTSPDFAQKLGQYRDDGARQCTFVIGGPDGLDASVRKRADLVLSFSPLTWPHQIVRALLCEQVYRAITIMSGHPYHRE